jgi:hypothetical protein
MTADLGIIVRHMGRRVKTTKAKTQFLEAIDYADGLYKLARPICDLDYPKISVDGFRPNQARRIIALVYCSL